MKHAIPTLILASFMLPASACGHAPVVRSGGHVTLVEEASPVEAFTIDRAAIDHALAQGAGWFIRQIGLRPISTTGDRFFGFQLLRLFPGQSFASPLPIHVGDIVQQINGSPIERPEQFMAVWNGLGTASHLSVRIVRDGRPLLITWSIRDPQAASAVSAVDR